MRCNAPACVPSQPPPCICAHPLHLHQNLHYLALDDAFPPHPAPSLRLQGPLILAERHLVAALGQRGVKLPAPLRTTATLCLLMAVAHPLFYNPVDRIPLFGRYVVLWRSWFVAAGSMGSALLA